MHTCHGWILVFVEIRINTVELIQGLNTSLYVTL